jgi:hypothetical protein
MTNNPSHNGAKLNQRLLTPLGGMPSERLSWNKWNELGRPDWLSMNLDSFQLSRIDAGLERIWTRFPLDGASMRRVRVRDPTLPGQPF